MRQNQWHAGTDTQRTEHNLRQLRLRSSYVPIDVERFWQDMKTLNVLSRNI